MTYFFDKLNLQPQERRWVFGIVVVVIVILNYVLVWPYFSEWAQVRVQIDASKTKIATYRRAIEMDNAPAGYKAQLAKLDKKGPGIVLDAGEIQLQKTIMAQTSPSFMPSSYTPVKNSSTQTNGFFEEQSLKITVDCEEKPLVDFLYNIGGDNSMIRVRALSIKPADNNRYKLTAAIELSATYQKKLEAKPAVPGPVKPGLSKPAMVGNKPPVTAPGAVKSAPQPKSSARHP